MLRSYLFLTSLTRLKQNTADIISYTYDNKCNVMSPLCFEVMDTEGLEKNGYIGIVTNYGLNCAVGRGQGL